jgi:hypothetical protein
MIASVMYEAVEPDLKNQTISTQDRFCPSPIASFAA